MISNLTPDEKALALAMSEISEVAFSAGWMTDLEFMLWDLVTSSDITYNRLALKKEVIQNLRILSEKCGGWIIFDDEKEEVCISLAEWKRMFAEKPNK